MTEEPTGPTDDAEEPRLTVSEVADLLRFLSIGRADYFHGPEPTNRSEIDALTADELTIWVESRTANQLADIIKDPERAWGWLPTWRLDEWERFAALLEGRWP